MDLDKRLKIALAILLISLGVMTVSLIDTFVNLDKDGAIADLNPEIKDNLNAQSYLRGIMGFIIGFTSIHIMLNYHKLEKPWFKQ